MACNQCFCLACVRTNTVALVERCGKFQAIKGPGCQCLVWPVDSIVGRVSLRVRQLDVNCETKTKDNVFVNVVISVQYQVVLEKAFDAFYKLANPEIQIQAYVFDVVRSELPKMELDESFSNKEQLANEVKHHLDETMMSFGYSIIKALVTDISPDARVKMSMNEINASRRLREAAKEKDAPAGAADATEIMSPGEVVVEGVVVEQPAEPATAGEVFGISEDLSVEYVGREGIVGPLKSTDAVVDVFAMDRGLFDAANAAKARTHWLHGRPGNLALDDGEDRCMARTSVQVLSLIHI